MYIYIYTLNSSQVVYLVILNPFGSQILFLKLDHHSQALEVNTTPQKCMKQTDPTCYTKFLPFFGVIIFTNAKLHAHYFALREISQNLPCICIVWSPPKWVILMIPVLRSPLIMRYFLLLHSGWHSKVLDVLSWAFRKMDCLGGQTHRGTAPNTWILEKFDWNLN